MNRSVFSSRRLQYATLQPTPDFKTYRWAYVVLLSWKAKLFMHELRIFSLFRCWVWMSYLQYSQTTRTTPLWTPPWQNISLSSASYCPQISWKGNAFSKLMILMDLRMNSLSFPRQRRQWWRLEALWWQAKTSKSQKSCSTNGFGDEIIMIFQWRNWSVSPEKRVVSWCKLQTFHVLWNVFIDRCISVY